MNRQMERSNIRRRIFGFGGIGLALLIASGCASNELERRASSEAQANLESEQGLVSAGKGYIIDTEQKEGILVVSPEKEDFSANGGTSDYYDATFFSGAPEANEVQVGMYVNVWVEKDSVMLASYPGQAKAARIEIEDDVQPEGAKLTQSEAVRKAIEGNRAEEFGMPVVLGAKYDAQRLLWTIDLLDEQRKPITVEIDDE